MVERILSISGKPGLYRMLSQGKNMLIVENIATKKRQPAYNHDKVISLADVAMYTTEGEVPLYNVFATIAEKNNDAQVDIKGMGNDELREYFAQYLPKFDRDRVYTTDIKKLFQWYNILVANGVTKFKNDEIKEDQAAEAAEAADEAQVKPVEEKAEKKTKKKTAKAAEEKEAEAKPKTRTRKKAATEKK